MVWLAGIALAIGVATVVYRGPGRALVRGHVGDIGAAMLVYAVVGILWQRGSVARRAAVTFGFALAMELGQLGWAAYGRSGAGAIVLGSVFDPWDVLAYVIGIALAVAWDRRAMS